MKDDLKQEVPRCGKIDIDKFMSKEEKKEKAIGSISDGYHTFNELYEHRHALFGAFIQLNGGWKSKLHSDGTMYEGWFIAGTEINGKQISYHLPIRLWDDFPAIEKENTSVWDGHTPEDVVNRLKEFWRDYNKKEFGKINDGILTGKDAERFEEAINNVKPIPPEDLARMINNYNSISKSKTYTIEEIKELMKNESFRKAVSTFAYIDDCGIEKEFDYAKYNEAIVRDWCEEQKQPVTITTTNAIEEECPDCYGRRHYGTIAMDERYDKCKKCNSTGKIKITTEKIPHCSICKEEIINDEYIIKSKDIITHKSCYIQQVPEYYMKEIKIGIYKNIVVDVDWKRLAESKAYKMNIEEVIKYLEEAIKFMKEGKV